MQIMKGRNPDPENPRRLSAEPPRHRKSLEPDALFYLARRESQNDDSHKRDSEPVSPHFGATKSRPTHRSGGSNKSLVEAIPDSATSSLSLGREYRPNVSDWNERVQRETRPLTGGAARHTADPPRPAREGYEWVWFPEGYWAEREKPESSSKAQKGRKWFSKPSQRQSDSSSPSRGGKERSLSADAKVPRIQIGGTTSHGSTSPTSVLSDEKTHTPSTPGSKIKKGLTYVSPTHPHFTSPNGVPEGLYCKVKRNIETTVTAKPQLYSHDASLTTSATAVPSRTATILEGASGYLIARQRQQQQRNGTKRSQRLSETPNTISSFDSRPRRKFGLAPWHRRTSQESLLSVSSSVHKLLMGKTPVATPSRESSYTYTTAEEYERVEISEPGNPTFLPSEARRVKTPPVSGHNSPRHQPRGFFFDISPATLEDSASGTSSSEFSTITYPPRTTPRGRAIAQNSGGNWEDDAKVRATLEKGMARQHQLQIEMSLLPEHLPNSPLCPKSPLHKSKGHGVCPYHGRRKSVEAAGGDNSYDDELGYYE